MADGKKGKDKWGWSPIGWERDPQMKWIWPWEKGAWGVEPYKQAKLSRYAAGVFERPGVKEAGIRPEPRAAVEEETWQSSLKDYISSKKLLEKLGADKAADLAMNKPLTRSEADALREELGEGYYLDYDEDIGGYRVERDPRYFEPPEKISPYQEAQLGLSREEAAANAAQRAWQQQWTQQETEWTRQYQQERLGWEREQAQMQQAEQERQYKSQLLANPMSWLQYSAYTGETPAIQEWMRPLMSQQYQTGQALPGWQTGQATGQPMSSLSELTTPSMQYFGRMGPTAQQQWLGYQQTRTGGIPEESMFRLQSRAAPGGRYDRFRWMR